MIELNKIYNEDCLEGMKRIESGSVDMILCDLPYGTTACKWDVVIPFEPLWEQYKRIIKPKGAIVLTASQPFTSALVMSNPKIFRYEWIWEKPQFTNFLNCNRQAGKVHESILVFGKEPPVYYPQKSAGEPYIAVKNTPAKPCAVIRTLVERTTTISNGERYPKSILKFNTEKGLHQTQKPVALFEYLIKTYMQEGETVLDNCIGSGTTAIACINTNRNYIGFEKDKEYYEKANERIKEIQPRLIA